MDAVNSSGWWTVITSPLDLTQYTLDNYRQAWTGEIAHSFVNSLAVTLPAIAIPILVAGFAPPRSPSCASAGVTRCSASSSAC